MTKEKRDMQQETTHSEPVKLEETLRGKLPQLEERLANLKQARYVSQELLKLEVSF
jgi:hypothetical protein